MRAAALLAVLFAAASAFAPRPAPLLRKAISASAQGDMKSIDYLGDARSNFVAKKLAAKGPRGPKARARARIALAAPRVLAGARG